MVSANVDTAIAGTTRCVSCDAPLAGPYCSRCGERTLEPDALTLRHFAIHTVAHELLQVDSALWRTLRLLFTRPGQMSLEYAAGRRRPYVNPFRLLLIAIVAYALISSSGFIVTWNFGSVTMSIAPAVVRRGHSVETTIAQIDPYMGCFGDRWRRSGRNWRARQRVNGSTIGSRRSRSRSRLPTLYCSPRRCISSSDGNGAASSSTPPSACTPSASS